MDTNNKKINDKDTDEMNKEKDSVQEETDENLENLNESLQDDIAKNDEKATYNEKQDENQDKEEEGQESEVDVLKEKLKEADDKYKRLLAEFDNFRKRSEKESMQMIDIGASVVLNKILPIVDNFERAVASIPEELKENSFVDGVDKIYKQVLKTFEEIGVKPIEAVGKPFDPNFHNAVMTDDKSDAEVDTITEELQKGYTYKDQVLRHSMVKVKK